MKMMQDHEIWKESMFPISLKSSGLQRIFHDRAISEIHTTSSSQSVPDEPQHPPTVYVNYGLLQQLQSAGHVTTNDIVAAFVIFTERMLSKSLDPKQPRTCQFIDLSGVSIISTSGFRVDALKQIYNTFEPNYPETLHKMVIYPVSTLMVRWNDFLIVVFFYSVWSLFHMTHTNVTCYDCFWQSFFPRQCVLPKTVHYRTNIIILCQRKNQKEICHYQFLVHRLYGIGLDTIRVGRMWWSEPIYTST
jgi:CRAL/TRIO domain